MRRMRALAPLIPLLALGLAPPAPRGAPRPAPREGTTEATRARVRSELKGMPLSFVSNAGQLDRRVRYYVQGKDTSLYLTPSGLTIALSSGKRRYAVRQSFRGARAGVVPVGEGRSPTVVSYFKGRQSDWRTGLPTYREVA